MSVLGPGGSRSGLGGQAGATLGGPNTLLGVSATPVIVINLVASAVFGITANATTGQMTVLNGGRYKVHVDCSFITSANNTLIAGAIYVNGVAEALLNVGIDRQMSASAAVGSASGSGILTLSQGDVLDVRFTSTVATSITFNRFAFNVQGEDAPIAPQVFHNISPDLQGGVTDEYYHQDVDEYKYLGPLAVEVGLSANVSISTSVLTTVAWGNEVIDRWGSWAISPNPSRLVTPSIVNSGDLMQVRLLGLARFADASDSTRRRIRFIKNGNGATTIRETMYPAINGAPSISQCDSGWLDVSSPGSDYYEMQVQQDSGGSVLLTVGSMYAMFVRVTSQ